MRITRKLVLLCAMAVTALALTASAASAGPIVIQQEEPGTNHPCETVENIDHVVTGNCHVLFSSASVPLLVHTGSAEVVISDCRVDLEARLNSNGTGWVSAATLSGTAACTRRPCDEVTGEFIPWPATLAEEGPGLEEVESTFCLRTAASGPGGAGTPCEVHLPFRDLGSHEYEIGTTHGPGPNFDPQYPCEGNPAVEIRFNPHLRSVPSFSEDLEVTHN